MILTFSSTPYCPPDEPLKIIHKDSSVIILDKPSGLLTVPGKLAKHRDCLLTRVRDQIFGALLVHRLDMDTSGVIIFARTRYAQTQISKQFENRKVEKKYIARVFGHLKERKGVIDLPIISDWSNRPLQKICLIEGKEAITRFKLIKHEKRNFSLVELRPVTGRSHQLRLHMKSIGHPIVGDRLYADNTTVSASNHLNLHSSSITFCHPKTNQLCTFDTKNPQYFQT